MIYSLSFILLPVITLLGASEIAQSRNDFPTDFHEKLKTIPFSSSTFRKDDDNVPRG